MKTFFSTTVFAVVGIAAFQAEASQLRAGVVVTEQLESSDIRVTMNGLVSEATEDDMYIISKSIVNAYNEVNTLSGSFILAFDVETSFRGKLFGEKKPWMCSLCPDDASATVDLEEATNESQIITARIASQWRPRNKWGCRYCPDDDSLTVGSASDTHKVFENKFCADIRSSGSDNLSNASGCAISFLEKAVDGKELFDEVCDSTNEILDAEFVMNGILHELTEPELKILTTSVKLAYNDAFMTSERTGFGYVKDTFAKLVNTHGIVHMKIAPLCFAVQDGTALPSFDTNEIDMKNVFEEAVCSKIRSSGIANLANANECSFRFVIRTPLTKDNSNFNVE